MLRFSPALLLASGSRTSPTDSERHQARAPTADDQQLERMMSTTLKSSAPIPEAASPPSIEEQKLVHALEERLIRLLGFEQLPSEVKQALRAWIRTEGPTLAKLPEREIQIALQMAQNVISQVLRSPRSFARKAQEAQLDGASGRCSCTDGGRCNNSRCPRLLDKLNSAKSKRGAKRVKRLSEGL